MPACAAQQTLLQKTDRPGEMTLEKKCLLPKHEFPWRYSCMAVILGLYVRICVFMSVCVCGGGRGHWGLLAQACKPPPPSLVTRVGLAENNKVMVGGQIWRRNPGNHLAHWECHLLYSSTKREGKAE